MTGPLVDAFTPVTAAQRVVVEFALNVERGPAASAGFSVEGFTNLNITHDTTPDPSNPAALQFGNSTEVNGAFAGLPGYGSLTAGDGWFNTTTYSAPEAGNAAWYAHIHEIGHALGLKHPHDTVRGFEALSIEYDEMADSLSDLASWIVNLDGNRYFMVRVNASSGRVLVDAGDTLTMEQFFTNENFEFA